MIARSPSAKLVALLLAGSVHAAMAVALIREEPVMMEGTAGAQEARIGNSFADMSEGVLTAEPVEDPTEVAEPEPVETTETETTEAEEVTEVLTAEPDPVAAETPPTQTAETAEPVEPVETTQPDQLAALVPVTPDGTLAAAPEETPAAPPEALPAAQPAPVEAAPAPPPEEVIAATDVDPVTTSSKRPVMRDPALETPVKRAEAPKPKPKPKPAPPKKVAQGNAQQNTVAGAADGAANARAKAKGVADARGKESGNAAASNYPGLVNQHLARVRRPSLNRRGTVRISFKLTASGGLASLSVGRSSGSARVDRAGLDMVRRAAPFPRPPAGASRSFSIPIAFD